MRPGMPSHPVQGGWGGAGRGGPHEEYRVDAVKAAPKGFGNSEIVAHDLDSHPISQADIFKAQQRQPLCGVRPALSNGTRRRLTRP